MISKSNVNSCFWQGTSGPFHFEGCNTKSTNILAEIFLLCGENKLTANVHTDSERVWVLTSVNASRQQVPLANRTIELWSGPVNQSASLSGLGLGPPAVAELGANHQEALGRWLWGNQPAGRFSSLKNEYMWHIFDRALRNHYLLISLEIYWN